MLSMPQDGRGYRYPKRPRINTDCTHLPMFLLCILSFARPIMMHLSAMEGIAKCGIIHQIQAHGIVIVVLR